VRFAAITVCDVSQRVFISVAINFVIDSVRKLLYIPSYVYSAPVSMHSKHFCHRRNVI
jgi:hypothetical protein